MKKIKLLVLITTISLNFLSCTKEGPEGPQGPQGIQGPAGQDGNANVIYGTVTLNSSNWTFSNGLWSTNTLNDNGITNDVYDGGVVMVYLKGGNSWVPIPYTAVASGGNLSLSIYFYYSVGSLVLEAAYSNLGQNSNPVTFFYGSGGTMTIKVVKISPSGIRPDLDYKNWSAVKEAYNLAE